MKIDNSIKKTSSTGVRTKQSGSASGTEKTETGSGAASSVNVNVSPQLQALSAMVESASVFDAGKVEEIKAAIAEGQFQVDSEKVADSLIGTTRELINNAKGKA